RELAGLGRRAPACLRHRVLRVLRAADLVRAEPPVHARPVAVARARDRRRVRDREQLGRAVRRRRDAEGAAMRRWILLLLLLLLPLMAVLALAIVGIVAAAVRESALEPGVTPRPRRRTLEVAIGAAVVGAIAGGNLWWTAEADRYARWVAKPWRLDAHADGC